MEQEKCLDLQLWHACAGSMVRIPAVKSTVFYFPQGHIEHANAPPNFHAPRVSPLILCRVVAVKFLADAETDEVYAKITLLPILENDLLENDTVLGLTPKPAYFVKILTIIDMDVKNGGGLSVLRKWADTIFPRLDFTEKHPVQDITAKDIHGETWKFRHIFAGRPRRHLLTTGWGIFVEQKKLITGDSVVFLRSESGDLGVGIRRAERGPRSFHVTTTSMLLSSGGYVDTAGRVTVDAVKEAMARAARGQAFEVVYNPRASTLEFCVKAADVRAAMKIIWCIGMRFKMAFEAEDSSGINWYTGTVSAVQNSDPIHWPKSPWRLLEVEWDEPALQGKVKRVSPWLVELVSSFSNMPFDGTKFSTFSPTMCYLLNDNINSRNKALKKIIR